MLRHLRMRWWLGGPSYSRRDIHAPSDRPASIARVRQPRAIESLFDGAGYGSLALAMNPNRHPWRLLAAIFLVVALVMPSIGLFQAGPVHGASQAIVATVGHSGCHDEVAAEQDAAKDPAKAPAHKAPAHSACAACAACAGHLLPMATIGAVFSRAGQSERPSALRDEASRPGIVTEALPKPPRSFA